MFRPGEVMSDNAMISVYPVGDEFYAFTESPVMTRVDPISLQTLDRVKHHRHIHLQTKNLKESSPERYF